MLIKDFTDKFKHNVIKHKLNYCGFTLTEGDIIFSEVVEGYFYNFGSDSSESKIKKRLLAYTNGVYITIDDRNRVITYQYSRLIKED